MKNLSVAIIGAGKVGSAFAISLRKKRIKITSIIDKNYKKAKTLAAKVKANHYSKKISEIPEKTNLFIISVQDRFIKEVSQELSKNFSDWKGKFAFHTSGSLNSDELIDLARKGCNVFSFHPNYSFASDYFKDNLINFNESVFAIETDSKISKRFAIDFCKKMNWDYIILKKDQKPIYHAFAVILSNYTVTQFFQIKKYLGNKAVKAYLNLLLSTIQNLKNLGVKNALTGPVIRGDVLTIKRNLTSLEDLNEDLKLIYKSFGLLSLELVEQKLDKQTFQEIKKLFSK